MKRRIRQNAWGNISGYEGNRKVREFSLNTSDAEIQAWLENGAEPESGGPLALRKFDFKNADDKPDGNTND